MIHGHMCTMHTHPKLFAKDANLVILNFRWICSLHANGILEERPFALILSFYCTSRHHILTIWHHVQYGPMLCFCPLMLVQHFNLYFNSDEKKCTLLSNRNNFCATMELA